MQIPSPVNRHHRQILLPQVGVDGQARLARARVLLVGCGALGTVIAEQLVRAGIGTLQIADRDVVEMTNLQRQVLFDESDVEAGMPKAVAAARRLREINSQTLLEPHIVDVHSGNIEHLAGCERNGTPVDLILDGTDNAETRYLLNDLSVTHNLPWIYGACVGAEGRCIAFHPPATACLRCFFPDPPAAGELPTCDTVGVLGPAAAIVASLQVTAAMKLLISTSRVDQQLITVDVWRGHFRTVATTEAKRSDCIACGLRRFDFLEGSGAGRTATLCGRDAVQVRPATDVMLDLSVLADKLAPVGAIQRTPYLLRCDLHDPKQVRLTIFHDGRAIIHGIADPERARSIYSRFVGN